MSDLNTSSLDLSNVGITPATIVYTPEPYTPGSTELKEYIVIAKRGHHIEELECDLCRDTSEDDSIDSSLIPDRLVSIANPRPVSRRQTHFWMTFDEAANLRNHPCVQAVELIQSSNPNIGFQPAAVRQGNFTKQSIFGTAEGNVVNYALYRCNFANNVYGTDTSRIGDFTYNLDGTGVDVVIMDDGIVTVHPEWEDASGNSRYVQIDWYDAAGLPNAMPTGYYNDPTSSHGTAVAGIVAGKTFGWASNARIFSLNTMGSNTLPHAEGLDLVRTWHENKPVDPETGFKRPTVINASWDVISYFMSAGGDYDPYVGHTIYIGYTLWGGRYRGNTWSGYERRLDYGLGLLEYQTGYGLGGANTTGTLYKMAGHSPSIDAAVEDAVDSGIIFVHSAGNDRYKQDDPSGPDWDNYANIIVNIIGGTPVLEQRYYHRPATPWANGVIMVGAVDTSVWDENTEKRAIFSSYGTAIDVWAPGVGIVTAAANSIGANIYSGNASFYQINESGTSFAAPEAAGVMALFAQSNPGANPTQAKKWLELNSVQNILYSTGANDDYANSYTIGGGPNRFLYNKFNQEKNNFTFSGGVTLTGVTPKVK